VTGEAEDRPRAEAKAHSVPPLAIGRARPGLVKPGRKGHHRRARGAPPARPLSFRRSSESPLRTPGGALQIFWAGDPVRPQDMWGNCKQLPHMRAVAIAQQENSG